MPNERKNSFEIKEKSEKNEVLREREKDQETKKKLEEH